jgi:hypothetical protein
MEVLNIGCEFEGTQRKYERRTLRYVKVCSVCHKIGGNKLILYNSELVLHRTAHNLHRGNHVNQTGKEMKHEVR